MKKRYIFLLVSAAAVISTAIACGKLYFPDSHFVANESIGVRTISSDTKSTVITTSELEKLGLFNMDIYVDDEYHNFMEDPSGNNPSYHFQPGCYPEGRTEPLLVRYAAGEWALANETPWVANIATTFWCWAPVNLKLNSTVRSVSPYAAPYNSATLNFSYARQGIYEQNNHTSLPNDLLEGGELNSHSDEFVDADNQDDLIFSYNKQTFDGSNDVVDITFYHALSQIRFAVSPNDGTFDTNLKIAQIAIRNVKQGGICTFNGEQEDKQLKFVWDVNASPLTSYCQNYDAKFSSAPLNWVNGSYVKDEESHKLYTAKNVFFITPQTLGSTAKLHIVFEDNGTYIEKAVSLSGDEWKPGKYYTYKINATVLGRTIKLSVNLLEWDNYDDKLFI